MPTVFVDPKDKKVFSLYFDHSSLHHK